MIDKKINFVLVYGARCNSYVKKDGTAAVKVRAYRNTETKYISTGVFLKPNQWNEKSKLVKNHDQATELNQRLRTVVSSLESYELEQVRKFGNITLQSLDQAFRTEVQQTFTAFYKSQLSIRHLKPQSIPAQQTTLNKLLEFYKKEVPFEVLTYKFLKSFELFLKGQGLKTNTIHGHQKNVRTYLNEAIRYDLFLENRNPFKKYKAPTEKTYKMPLIESELLAVEQWQPRAGKEHLIFARDFFLVSCYSGLRYSDVSKLKPSNFIADEAGLQMKIITQKVKKLYEINTRLLFPCPGATESKLELLLSKYLSSHIFGERVAMFKMEVQPLNRALKDLFAEIPEIRTELKEKVSTHYGRHTFCTLIAQKLPAPMVQYLMQHSNLNTSQIYINNTAEQINTALTKIVW